MEGPDAGAELRRNALRVVSNIASSSSANKGAVVAAGWPAVLAAALGDSCALVRESAVWAIINLTWR